MASRDVPGPGAFEAEVLAAGKPFGDFLVDERAGPKLKLDAVRVAEPLRDGIGVVEGRGEEFAVGPCPGRLARAVGADDDREDGTDHGLPGEWSRFFAMVPFGWCEMRCRPSSER